MCLLTSGFQCLANALEGLSLMQILQSCLVSPAWCCSFWERPEAPDCATLLQILPSRVRPLDNAQPPLTAHRPGIGMSAHGGLEYAR